MTLVSHTSGFIYLKTHKTASTSVEMLLEPFCAPASHKVSAKTHERHSQFGIVGKREGGRGNWYRKIRWRDHMSAETVKLGLGPEKWNQYTKVMTVRNPFDRIVSEYYYRIKKGVLTQQQNADQTIAAFREYANSKRWNDDTNIVMLNGKFVSEIVVYYENLENDISKMMHSLNLPFDRDTLRRENASGRVSNTIPIVDFYDKKTQEIVLKRMNWAFEYCGYSRDPADASTT